MLKLVLTSNNSNVGMNPRDQKLKWQELNKISKLKTIEKHLIWA